MWFVINVPLLEFSVGSLAKASKGRNLAAVDLTGGQAFSGNVQPFKLPLKVESCSNREIVVLAVDFCLWLSQVNDSTSILSDLVVLLVKVVFNNFFSSEDERLDHFVLEHVEPRDITSQAVDVVKTYSEIVVCLVGFHLSIFGMSTFDIFFDLLVQLLLSFAEGFSPLQVVELLQCLFRYIDLFLLIEVDLRQNVFVLLLGAKKETLYNLLEDVELLDLVPFSTCKV